MDILTAPLPSPARAAYADLERRFRRYQVLGHVEKTLLWDQVTFMPNGAASVRAEQLAELSALRIESLTDQRIPDLIEAAAEGGELNGAERANLLEMQRIHRNVHAVPKDLARAAALVGATCEAKWREAREANDFRVVQGALAKSVDLWRQIADAKASKLGCSKYDALVDQYEPGAKSETVASLITDLESWLPDLIERVLAKQDARTPPVPVRNTWLRSQQAQFFRDIMTATGFDFKFGRFDESAHPLCLGQLGDIRITTRWDSQSLLFGIKATLHETGHALYESGVPSEWLWKPVGMTRGDVLHESQALLYEVQLGRSRAFLEWLARQAAAHDPSTDGSWSAENLLASYRQVARTPIRIDADELTYPAHVIMRFRLERDLIEGRLSVDELPGAWNDASRKTLGLPVADDRTGCLQDIHWYNGTWGYFAVYIPGAIAAAQMFQAALAQLPHLSESIRQGDFATLRSWLREQVHSKASRCSTQEIMRATTGRMLDSGALRRHLEDRYYREL